MNSSSPKTLPKNSEQKSANSSLKQANAIADVDQSMPVSEHLIELRKRLVISLFFFMIAFLGAVYVEFEHNQPILAFFRATLDNRPVPIPLVFDELTEPFFTYLRVAMYTGIFLTFPILLSQIWLFVKPALYPGEQKLFWPFLLASIPLFIGGGLFGYFGVLPVGYDFFLGFINPETQPSLRMSAYLSLTIQLLFAFGLVFELPVIAFFLAKLGIIDSEWLKNNRKYAILVIFTVAAMLTPPDVLTQTLMAGPLIVLYEISIQVTKLTKGSVDTSEEPQSSDNVDA